MGTEFKNQDEANRIFQERFKGQPNFVTPYIIARGMIGGYAVELSGGEIFGDRVFGVTVLTSDGGDTNLSGSFPSQELAAKHIRLNVAR